MFPALLEFAELCRRKGLAVDDNWSQTVTAMADAFGETPEARRVLAAAEQIAGVEVREPSGRLLVWESLAISELDALIPITAAPGRPIQDVMTRVKGDPIRYMVSLTLSPGEADATRLFSTTKTGPSKPQRIWQKGRGMTDPR